MGSKKKKQWKNRTWKLKNGQMANIFQLLKTEKLIDKLRLSEKECPTKP